MSRKYVILPAIAIGLIAPSWAGTVYTREEAVKIALEKSTEIQSAQEDLVSTTSQVDGGYGLAYPSIDLNATVTRIFGLPDVDMKDLSMANELVAKGKEMGLDDPSPWDEMAFGAINGVANGMKAQGYRWQTSVGLTATQILYSGGKVGTGIDIAKSAKHVSEIALDNKKAEVRYNVENAFNQLIFMDSSIVILEESIKLTQSYVDLAVNNQKSGLGTELDVIRAQLQLDELQSTLEKTNKTRVVARNNLLLTMGLPFEADVQFQGTLRSPEEKVVIPDTSMANVKKRRKELAMLEESEKIQSKLIDLEKGDYLPTVVLVGGLKYGNNQNTIKDWNRPNWDNINKYVALSATMNLFNGMQTREKVTQAKSGLRSTQIQKESAERGFRLQIESCVNNLNDAEQQLGIKKRSVELAQKNQILTEASYNVGKETQLNLLESTMKLRNAKLNYMEAILNWNNAYNALLQATGEY
ncbi:MAG: TolC family protein [Fibrobacter sp.]|uniref:TolC family protein n=1 Tax=Fibrobacter sp. TaxID=35828 RepID=UPI001B271995|nr:TolC family protein [Fibrobacter sp.]MBO7061425.1 TolC family protein [Fibrobacter sp.]